MYGLTDSVTKSVGLQHQIIRIQFITYTALTCMTYSGPNRQTYTTAGRGANPVTELHIAPPQPNSFALYWKAYKKELTL